MSASENANPQTDSRIAAAPAADSAIALAGRLQTLRSRILPLLEAVKAEYTGRAAVGYPVVIDNIARSGVFGITLSPGFGLYFMTDGTNLIAETQWMQLRVDALSMANNQRYGGRPEVVREDIDETFGPSDARRLVSRLQNRWNRQQTRIYRVDS
ncbi:MAG TPA: hypothetical protein PLR44_04870 [Thermomicrobiales bacterium]|nr:hypothetical protein [Thermomicrobiales bacterium]